MVENIAKLIYLNQYRVSWTSRGERLAKLQLNAFLHAIHRFETPYKSKWSGMNFFNFFCQNPVSYIQTSRKQSKTSLPCVKFQRKGPKQSFGIFQFLVRSKTINFFSPQADCRLPVPFECITHNCVDPQDTFEEFRIAFGGFLRHFWDPVINVIGNPFLILGLLSLLFGQFC